MGRIAHCRRALRAAPGNLRPKPPIIHAMRHVFLALLIALLPLRGWVGDAMALAPLSAHLTGQALAAPSPAAPDAASDCHGHTNETADMGESSGACSHCDVCHGPGLAAAPGPALPPLARHTLQATPDAHCASTVPQPTLKPPIS